MKLSKKLLIVAILASLVAPATIKDNGRLHSSSEIIIVANGSNAPAPYDKDNTDIIISPKSINIIKVI